MSSRLLGLVSIRSAVVADDSRLSRSLLLGESLHVHAVRSMSAAGIPVDLYAPASSVVGIRHELQVAKLSHVEVVADDGRLGVALSHVLRTVDDVLALVIQDPLCPLVSTDFIRTTCREALVHVEQGRAVAAARAVTDTVKRLEDGVVVATVDRHTLRVLASPLIVPVAPLRRLPREELLAVDDVADLVALVRTVAPVHLTPAPALARRVNDRASLEMLEELSFVHASTGHVR